MFYLFYRHASFFAFIIAFSARENFKATVVDITQLTVDTNTTVYLGRGMRIGNCTTDSNPQRGSF